MLDRGSGIIAHQAPRTAHLNTSERKFGSSKFPWHPFPFNRDSLFTVVKYPLDYDNLKWNEEGKRRRRDPAVGPSYMTCLDKDEELRPCF
jgi:hypothetical protein